MASYVEPRKPTDILVRRRRERVYNMTLVPYICLILIYRNVILLFNFSETDCGRRQLYRPADGPVTDLDPYFDLGGVRSQRNISAVEGKTAKLSCTVRNLGDRMVRFTLFDKIGD